VAVGISMRSTPGCSTPGEAQGWLIARPMPAAQAMSWLLGRKTMR
jgi:hypothetical protein